MLEIGFGTSIRREWDWRVKRGESLRNLEAFAAFADPPAAAASRPRPVTATEQATAPEDLAPATRRRWWVLATMTVCLLVVITGNTILNVAIPTLQRELGATQGELQWAIDAYILVFAGLLFTWGVIGDRIGRKQVLLIGLAIFAVGSVLAAFSGSPIELIGWRAVMGIGGAAVQPTTLAVITNVFPPGERGRAIGVWAGTAGIAVAGGPLAGGAVLEHFWWGAVFLIGVPVAALGASASSPSSRSRRTPRPAGWTSPACCCRSAPSPGWSTGSSAAARAGLDDARRAGPAGRRRWCCWCCSSGCSGAPPTPRWTSAVPQPGVLRRGRRAGAELLRAAGRHVLPRLLPAGRPRLHARCRAAPRSSRSRSAWRSWRRAARGWPSGSAPRRSAPPGSC